MQINASATYRLQLHPNFGFEQAAALVDYLRELGVSHVYTSPYLQATEGSTHGYDVVDPTRVNWQLGGADKHALMCEAIQAAGLQHMIDVVPNHMAIAGQQNPWWWDVLENGPSSLYAMYFDVDWETSEERWQNRVLLPVLGDHYGRILESGEIVLQHENAHFSLHYHDHLFPVDPSSLAPLLTRAAEACGSETLGFLAESYRRMPRPSATGDAAVEKRHRDKAVLFQLLSHLCHSDLQICGAVDAEVKRLNKDIDGLDEFIDQQNYRLAFWRTASRDLGYRRFFDITDLAGLRIEAYRVFADTHALIAQWVDRGWVQALRIDHPDGLRDPLDYFKRLRHLCPQAWIVAEKILEPGERLRADWPIQGTTGYDFLNLTGGLFVEPANEAAFNHIYCEFLGVEQLVEFESLVHECKQTILTESLQSELNRLSNLFIDICERHRRHRDYTRHDLHEALLATAQFFPVYRSYATSADDRLSAEDKVYIQQAIAYALEHREDLDAELFHFLERILLRKITGKLETELALRFQQLTGPAMAKGVEDTAFYRFNRMLCLNEVGGNPAAFGVKVSDFHEACRLTQAQWPLTMLASTTHDTKRSEDVRARLAAISEFPESWATAVKDWSRLSQQYRSELGPDRNTEYLIYQTLVGAWPISQERMHTYMQKAMREAKEHSSWTQQNESYENAVQEFVAALLQDPIFCQSLSAFVDQIKMAGYKNALALTLIKLTAPGIPDIYQGTELWDFSLVDPDNRRPVEFSLRQQLIKTMQQLSVEEVLNEMEQGLPKLWLIQKVLRLRQQYSQWFSEQSSYCNIVCSGRWSDNVVAFSRAGNVVVVVPRLSNQVNADWQDTAINLPQGQWKNYFTQQSFGDSTKNTSPLVQALLEHFPVALLVREECL